MRKIFHKSYFYLLLITFTFLFMMVIKFELGASNQENIALKHRIQMPIAVDKAVTAGFPSREVKKIASLLNKGKIPSVSFNNTLRKIPFLANKVAEAGGVSAILEAQVKSGLRGEKFARAVYGKFRSYGVDTRKFDNNTVDPLKEDFYTKKALKTIKMIDQINPSTPPQPRRGSNPTAGKNYSSSDNIRGNRSTESMGPVPGTESK